jgi:3-hydroxyisobutyrate dehydrogenase-like beta-hydroxyacid dehydrogenase
MISGSTTDIDQVEPVMKAMGTAIFRCGELGAAEVVKVINNMLGIANIYLAAEALQLASRYNVNLRQLIPILEVSSGRNFMTQDAELTAEQYQAWARSPEAFMSLKNIVSKDLHLAQDLAGRKGLKLELLDDVSVRVDATTQEVMKTWNDVALRLDSDSERGKAGKV